MSAIEIAAIVATCALAAILGYIAFDLFAYALSGLVAIRKGRTSQWLAFYHNDNGPGAGYRALWHFLFRK